MPDGGDGFIPVTFSKNEVDQLSHDIAAAVEIFANLHELHRPITRFVTDQSDDLSFESERDALDYYGEGAATVIYSFIVCAECGRLETNDPSGDGERRPYESSIWPCPTVQLLDGAGVTENFDAERLRGR